MTAWPSDSPRPSLRVGRDGQRFPVVSALLPVNISSLRGTGR